MLYSDSCLKYNVDPYQTPRSAAFTLGLHCLPMSILWDAGINGLIITKTYLYNFDPLKPQFYIVKLGFTGVYIIFLISAPIHRMWVLVRRVPTIYVLSRNVKNIRIFYLKIFFFLLVKFSVYLNRYVFVMAGNL